MSQLPIADHALLSDRHSAALVTREGSVDWLAFPRFDSPSLFARLLDDEAGHWSIRPAAPARTSRRYLPGTMVLETTFETNAGTLVICDALALGPDTDVHRLGAGAPHCLIRQVSCSGGVVDVEVEYAPRPEYGLIHPLLAPARGGVTGRGGADWLVLTAPLDMELQGAVARGRVRLSAGSILCFGLQRSTLGEQPARVWSQGELAGRLETTISSWPVVVGGPPELRRAVG